MSPQNPLQGILDWLATQPKEARSNVAMQAATLIPILQEIDPLEYLENPNGCFEQWLTDCLSLKNKDVISLALHLRELIQFFVIEHFCGKEQWEKITQTNLRIIDDLKRKGHGPYMTDPLEKAIQSAQFRQKLWEKVGSDWASFVESTLSNKHLHLWLVLNPDIGSQAED